MKKIYSLSFKEKRNNCFLFFKRSYVLLFLFFLTVCNVERTEAQIQFWSDDFEDSGSPSSGSRTPSVSFNASNERYFDRVTSAQVNWTNSIASISGTKFWGGADIDNLTGQNTQSSDQNITWASINIAGKTNLSFKGLFAAGNSGNYDHFPGVSAIDYMLVEYRIDGGSWTSLVRFFPNQPNSGSGALALETTGDELAEGEGIALNGTFTEFTATIVGTGTTLDLRFACQINGTSFEEIGIDNFRLFQAPSCTPPTITVNPPNRAICAGNNTTFSASATGATAFQWQVNTGSGFTDIVNGAPYSGATTTTLTITGVTAGMSGYLYRMVAINGVPTCSTNTNERTLTVSSINLNTGSQNNVSCNGGSNGAASVSPTGGIGPYTYSWSPAGGTGSSASGLTAGFYTVTVTDDIGCQATRNFTIAQPSVLSALISSKTDASTLASNDGSATVSPSGGTGPYTYSWAPSGGTSATANGLSADTYTVTVRDANDCSTMVMVTISVTTLPINLIDFQVKLAPAGSVQLNWSSASESNNDYYLIERSQDGAEFKTLAIVNAKSNGNSSSTLTYSLEDQKPEVGINYYKLSQFDKDGAQNQLGIKSVNFSFKAEDWIVYPNPTDTEFNILVPTGVTGTRNVVISSVDGKLIYTAKLKVNNGKLSGRFVTAPAPGVYSVNVEGLGTKNLMVK